MSTAENKNYYELLGLAREASAEEIKAAYREIARVFHPDSNFFDEIIEVPVENESEDIFKQITAAYNTLVDPEKRADYDSKLPRGLKDWDEAGPAVLTNLQSMAKKPGRQRKPTAERVIKSFGVLRDVGGPVGPAEHSAPMSEMIHVSQSFWNRIRRFFGLP